MNKDSNNITEIISVLNFDHAWTLRERLLVTVACPIFGCLMNGFFISAFFVEDDLKKIGLVFQALIGLSDIIVTMGVIPTSAVLLLSGQSDSKSVCNALQFFTEASTYSYSIFFAMMSLETFYRQCRSHKDYDGFISKIDIIVVNVLVLTFGTAASGVYLGLDYDCCYRSHSGNYTFRIVTSLVFHVIPSFITIYCSVCACMEMRFNAKICRPCRMSHQYKNDRNGHYANIVAFVLYAGGWMPYLISVYWYPFTSDSHFYRSVWIGIARSVVTSFVYGVLDRNFRRAYGYLFQYCFCKSLIKRRMVRRHMQAAEYYAATEEVHLRMGHHNRSRRPALCPRRDTP
ncbi:hypothetical protein MSG28_001192 [Choristoneura fumiferana]|uniref:Uncharacterized protein n=1 Tax=Choristoneura fumiferana TaxID=7141 RepID=A0ACC0K4F6_CHOFU|nr:hypothetical protein MSG28_001192 [Choristoneura fumiferana]